MAAEAWRRIRTPARLLISFLTHHFQVWRLPPDETKQDLLQTPLASPSIPVGCFSLCQHNFSHHTLTLCLPIWSKKGHFNE